MHIPRDAETAGDFYCARGRGRGRGGVRELHGLVGRGPDFGDVLQSRRAVHGHGLDDEVRGVQVPGDPQSTGHGQGPGRGRRGRKGVAHDDVGVRDVIPMDDVVEVLRDVQGDFLNGQRVRLDRARAQRRVRDVQNPQRRNDRHVFLQ